MPRAFPCVIGKNDETVDKTKVIMLISSITWRSSTMMLLILLWTKNICHGIRRYVYVEMLIKENNATNALAGPGTTIPY